MHPARLSPSLAPINLTDIDARSTVVAVLGNFTPASKCSEAGSGQERVFSKCSPA